MKAYDIRAIVKKGKIGSELEYERAQLADRKLRLLVKEDLSLKPLRKELRDLLHQYQETHWRDEASISDQQVEENDLAEKQVDAERQFLDRRKELIINRLAELGLKQKDLGNLLNHSKSYTSELLHGIRPFSLGDLILLHKLLKIELDALIPMAVSHDTLQRLLATLEKLNLKNLRLNLNSLELIKSSE